MTATHSGRRFRFILLLVLGAIATANAFVYFIRLTDATPLSPWEPAIAMEAVRLNEGLPLYELSHATHMYGPLLTVAVAGIFKITGFNLLAARIVFSLIGLGLAAFLSTLFCRGERLRWWLAAFILFSALNLRTSLIFVSAQPDCVAALLALVGLWLWGRPDSTALLRSAAVGLFLTAFLFKQTSAAFALIPPAQFILGGRHFNWRRLLVASIPALSIVLLIGLIRVIAPALFTAMIGVPASIHVSWLRAASGAVLILSSFPVFYLGAAALLIRERYVSEMDHWIYAGVMVLVPTAIWTFAKSGGAPNSFLYAYLAMASLLVSQFPSIARWIDSLSAPRVLPATLALALSLLGSYFFEFEQSLTLLSSAHGDERIGEAIAIARHLGGKVISPEDPSIAYQANGYLGGSVFFELDAHAIDGEWPSRLPPEVIGELSRAKAVIEVHGYVPMPGFLEALLAQKFRPINVPVLEKSAYTLWLKSPAAVSHNRIPEKVRDDS